MATTSAMGLLARLGRHVATVRQASMHVVDRLISRFAREWDKQCCDAGHLMPASRDWHALNQILHRDELSLYIRQLRTNTFDSLSQYLKAKYKASPKRNLPRLL